MGHPQAMHSIEDIKEFIDIYDRRKLFKVTNIPEATLQKIVDTPVGDFVETNNLIKISNYMRALVKSSI